ncbi:MAG: hypothetical protein ACM3XN_02410 [Chloroflexota bacterium]
MSNRVRHSTSCQVGDTSASSEEMAAASDEVVNVVEVIGQASEGNLAAVQALEHGATRMREALGRVAAVAGDLSSLTGSLGEIVQGSLDGGTEAAARVDNISELI